MILQQINEKMPLIRQNIVFVIFVLLILVSSFFTGEWNNWLQAFIMVITSLLLFYIIYLFTKSDYIFRSWKQKIIFNPNTYLVVFILIVFLTSFGSTNKYSSFSQFLLLLSYVVIYFSAYKYFNSWKKIRIITKIVLYIGTLTAIISLIMYVIQSSSRANGLLFNANALGSYLIFSFFIGFLLLFNKYSNKKVKIIDIISLIIILLALLLTYSYTSWVSILLPLFMVFIFFRKIIFSKRILRWGIVVIILAFLSLSFLRFQNSNNISEAVKVYETISSQHVIFSFQQRNNFNLSAIDIFQDNQFTGTGYNTYQSIYGQYNYTIDEQPRYAHNYYLQTLSELGIFGFISFLIFIIIIVYRGIVVIRNEDDDENKIYLLAIYSGLLGSMIHAAFDFGWQFPAVFIVFWIFIGIINSYSQKNNLLEKIKLLTKRDNSVTIIRVVGIIIALLLLIRGFTLLLGNYYYQSSEIATQNGELEDQWSNLLRSYQFDPKPSTMSDYVQAKTKFSGLLKAEDYIDLENKMLNLIKVNDQNYYAHWILGRIYFMQKDYNRAIGEFGIAIEYNPVFRPDFHYDLAISYFEENDYNTSKKIIIDILNVYPKGQFSSNPSLPTQLAYLNLLLGRIYKEQGNSTKAEYYFNTALELWPNFSLAENELKDLH